MCTHSRAVALQFVATIWILLLGLPAALQGGIGPNGFFDEYLVLGPYLNPEGAEPGIERQAADFLCDGETGEDSIVPAEGLELGFPKTGGCAPSNSGFSGPGVPAVRSVPATGDLLDLLSFDPNPRVVAYAWVYIENLTPDALKCTLALASDDGIQVKVNGVEVFNFSAPRWYGEAGVIQNRLPILLIPGSNLVQFKVFQGGGVWGLRARLEDTGTSAPYLQNDPRVWVGTEGSRPGMGSSAVRTIAVGVTKSAVITVAVGDRGAPYTLEETIGPGWSVLSATGSPSIVDRTITWKDATEATLSYKLVRSGPSTKEESTIWGYGSIGDGYFLVQGDVQLPGPAPAFVQEVLLTPPFLLSGIGGCSIDPKLMEGSWIGDGKGLTDENIAPQEGLEFRPAFRSARSQAAGLFQIGQEAHQRFWTIPGDPLRSMARLARVASDGNGTFDFSHPIYASNPSDCMNIAYFFVVNDTGQDPLPVSLGLGSDDGAVVRVNGEAVWSHQACRPHASFEDKLMIALRPGKNLIAVYTFNGTGDYGMSVRFEDETGAPLAFDTTLDPEGYESAFVGSAEIIQIRPRWVGVSLQHPFSLRGGELGLAYDPALVVPFAVRPGTGLPPGVHLQVQMEPGNQCSPEAGVAAGITFGWILPTSSPLLPPGNHEVIQILFAPADGVPIGSCSPLRFVPCLGVAGAPVRNVVTHSGGNSIPVIGQDGQVCILEEPPFLRGDANADSALDISDPIVILRCLFLGGACGNCPDAIDVDGNGAREITDAIHLLTWRFLDGPPPAAPFPECQPDPITDELPDCEESQCP